MSRIVGGPLTDNAEMSEIRLAIDQITPGMRLAEAVRNEAGITLMPAGIRLTPMFIIRLKKWNIPSLLVSAESKDDEDEAASEPKRPQPRAASISQVAASAFARSIAAEVANWFTNVQNDPLMMQLRILAARKLVAHGEEGIINLMRREDGVAAAEEKA